MKTTARLADTLRRCQYELLLFLYFAIEMLRLVPMPAKMHDWLTTHYALTWEIGFHSRVIVGSLLHLLAGRVTPHELWYFLIAHYILIAAALAWLLGGMIRRADARIKTAAIFLVILFLASPASVTWLMSWDNYGRLDLFLILSMILSLILVHYNRYVYIVPVIALLTVAVHQIFIVTYLAPVILVFIFEAYNRPRHRRRLLLAAGLTGLLSLGGFIWLQFLAPHVAYPDAAAMADALRQRTDLPVSARMLEYEYFSSLSRHWHELVLQDYQRRIITAVITLIMLAPLLLLFIWIWKKTVRSTHGERMPWIMSLFALAPLATLPAFIIAIDWGRWFAAVWIGQFSCLFYFVISDFPPVTEMMQSLESGVKKHLFAALLLFIYLESLGKFGVLIPLNIAYKASLLIY